MAISHYVVWNEYADLGTDFMDASLSSRRTRSRPDVHGDAYLYSTLTGAIGTIVGGKLVQSYLDGKEKYFAIVSALFAILFLSLIFNAPSVTLVITFQSLCTIFHGFVFATVFALPHKVFSKKVIGSAIGIVNLGGMLGAFLAPMVMGYLIETFNGSYTSAFVYLIVCSVLTIIAAVTLNLKKSLSVENAKVVNS